MQNSKSLLKGKLKPEILLPTSKSYANRLLIIAARKDSPFAISGLPMAQDVTHLIAALQAVGLQISVNHQSLSVHNSFPACEKTGFGAPTMIAVGEGGTTARFLAALLTLGKEAYILQLAGGLELRPWQELISFINQHGGKASLTGHSLCLQGPLTLPAEVSIDCSRTTQFATGLQLAYPAVKITPRELTSSLSYWSMTQNLLDATQHSHHWQVPLDWSSASYPLAFAALNHAVFFPGLAPDAWQADAKFYNVLSKLGAVTVTAEGLWLRPIKQHSSLQIEVHDALDLVPALCFLLAHIEGQHTLRGIQNLVHKESDRLRGLQDLLKQFQRSTYLQGNDLMIEGHSQMIGTRQDLQMANDHRMVMTGALFLRHHAGGTISPADAVKKSFPGFYQIFQD